MRSASHPREAPLTVHLLSSSGSVEPRDRTQATEDGHTELWCEELHLHATGETLEEAVADMVDEILLYMLDWHTHLRTAPNHAARSSTVQMLGRSDRQQIEKLIIGQIVAPEDRRTGASRPAPPPAQDTHQEQPPGKPVQDSKRPDRRT